MLAHTHRRTMKGAAGDCESPAAGCATTNSQSVAQWKITMFEHATLDIPCPHCAQKIEKTVGWLKNHDMLTCPSCSGSFGIRADELSRGLKQAEKLIGNFGAYARRLCKG